MPLVLNLDYKYEPERWLNCIECMPWTSERPRQTTLRFYDRRKQAWFPVCQVHAQRSKNIIMTQIERGYIR